MERIAQQDSAVGRTSEPSMRAGGTFVHEGHGLGARHVPRVQAVDLEPSSRNKSLNGPVEMTAATHPRPKRIETVLPLSHAGVRGQPVFDEEQPAAGLEDATHFLECPADVIYRTHG